MSGIYHVGIVVESLAPAMAEFTAATGITWGAQQRDVLVTYATPDGPRTWNTQFVLSEEPPHIELLERVEGSIWSEPGFHHLGMWSDDVDADSRDIETGGCPWQAAMSAEDGTRLGGCYHLLPISGARLELVSRERSAPRLQRYLAGGSYM